MDVVVFKMMATFLSGGLIFYAGDSLFSKCRNIFVLWALPRELNLTIKHLLNIFVPGILQILGNTNMYQTWSWPFMSE